MKIFHIIPFLIVFFVSCAQIKSIQDEPETYDSDKQRVLTEKAQDKDFVQIWDITSTCKFAKRHLTKRKAFYREANYPFSVEKTEWQ